MRNFFINIILLNLMTSSLYAQDSAFVTLAGQLSLPGTPIGVDVQGNYAFVVSETPDSLFVIDVSDPSNPVKVNSKYVRDVLAIDVDGSYAYTVGDSLEVYDITIPSTLSKVGSQSIIQGYGIFVSGSIAYTTRRSGSPEVFTLYNIGDPASPELIGSTSLLFERGFGVSSYGGFSYVANGDSGLRIIDVSDPQTPVLKGIYITPGFAEGVVFVSGDHVFVANGSGGLQIIDVSNPDNPSGVGLYDTPGVANDVVVEGNFAYVADDLIGGMRVIYVKDLSNPVELGHYNPGGQAEDIGFANNLIYVADRTEGLLIYRKMMVVVSLPMESFSSTMIPLTVSELEGLGITSFQFVLTYDSTVIDSAEVFVDSTSILWGRNWTMATHSSPGQTAVALADTGVFNGSGTLLSIVFSGQQDAPRGIGTTVNISDLLLNEGAALGITEPVTVINGFPFGDVTGNGFVTAFDASLTFQHALGKIILNEQEKVKADVSGDTLITEFDVSLILQFVVGLIDSFPVELTMQPLFIASGDLDINDLAISELDRFSLYVMISDVEGVFSGAFEIEYDNKLFTLEDVKAGELTENFLVGINSEGSAERVIFAGAKELNESGELIELLFSINGDFSGESVIRIRPERLNINNIVGKIDSAIVRKFITGVTDNSLLPVGFVLEQNYPNPFNPSTDLRFYLPEAAFIKLEIIDLRGREINTLLNSEMASGWHSVPWEGENLDGLSVGSGIYLYRIVGQKTGREIFTATKKMVLLR